MNVIHNDDGKIYVPASDFYKEFIFSQLYYSFNMGKDKYEECQTYLTFELNSSEVFLSLEPKFIVEALDLLQIPYEDMKEIHAKRFDAIFHDIEGNREIGKRIRKIREKASSDNQPKLRLVK